MPDRPDRLQVFEHTGGSIYDVGTVEEPPGWYYWDEYRTGYHGPFPSEIEAQRDLDAYLARDGWEK